MSFLKIVDPAKREQIVKEFLALKKDIRANELAEKTGKIELQTGLSELFKPITETQKTATKEITEGLRPIREGIEQLPQRLPPRQKTVFFRPHPTFEEKPYAPPYFAPPLPKSSEEEEEEEEEEEVFTDSDTTFGIYETSAGYLIGNKPAFIAKDSYFINGERYKKNTGLERTSY